MGLGSTVVHVHAPRRHGDMLYLMEKKSLDPFPTLGPSEPPTEPEVKVQEDEVDVLLAGVDGRVHREKDSQMYVN